MHKGDQDICTLKIQYMCIVNELAWIYESRDVQGCMFAAKHNIWIKYAQLLMKYAQK